MRSFLLLIILCLGFSGFSAAAHAFTDASCATHTHAADVDKGTPDCPDHQKKDDDKSKGKCLDCSHCCASHVLGLSAFSLEFPLVSAALNPLPVKAYAGHSPPSLLRPPKSLV